MRCTTRISVVDTPPILDDALCIHSFIHSYTAENRPFKVPLLRSCASEPGAEPAGKPAAIAAAKHAAKLAANPATAPSDFLDKGNSFQMPSLKTLVCDTENISV